VGGEATVSFDASGSWDDGTIASYIWDWDGDGIFDENTSNQVIQHTYTSAGTYYVTLKIKDNKGKESIKQSGTQNTLTVVIS
jgi:PKD repeat protein